MTTTRRAFHHLKLEKEGVQRNSLGILMAEQSIVDTYDGERISHALASVLNDLPYGLPEPDLKAAVIRYLHRHQWADDADEFVEMLHDALDVYDEVLQAEIRSESCRQIVVGNTLRIVDGYIYDRRHLTNATGTGADR